MIQDILNKRNIVRLFLLGLGIFFIIVIINRTWGYQAEGIQLFYNFLLCQLYTFSLYTVNTIFFRFLDVEFKDEFSFRRFFFGVTGSFVLSISVVFILRLFTSLLLYQQSWNEFIAKESIADYVFSVLVTFVIQALVYLARMNQIYNQFKLRQQSIKTDTVSAELETLKSQIDPHFLFNSLNVLGALIEENPEKAFQFNASLSKVYRYLLEQKDKDLISVEEELNFAKTYMELMQLRFEGGLDFEIENDGFDADSKVVPLSLQLLLENALKHNQATVQKPLKIRIRFANQQLIVENSLQIKQVFENRKGLGLDNIISRYELLTDRKVAIEKTIDTFKVALPLLTQKAKIMDVRDAHSDEMYNKAKKQVGEIRKFYRHLTVYCVIISFLIILNLITDSRKLWFIWPMISWGVGVALHAVKVFVGGLYFNNSWEDKMIDNLLDKKENRTRKPWE